MLRVISAVLACAIVSGSAADDKPLLVSAAISLTDALEEIGAAYAVAGGESVRFNFAASNVLARQIVNGAPADLFISADEAQMHYAEQRGAIDPASRVTLLRNRLAVVVPSDRRQVPGDVQALLADDVKRIAIGDPAAVPAGVYARAYLERAGVWRGVQRKLLPLVSVRAALAAVESGGADAGFVYESDAGSASRVRLAFVVDGPHAPRIVYPAAVTTRVRDRAAAARFMQFLRGEEASAILRRHKFTVDG